VLHASYWRLAGTERDLPTVFAGVGEPFARAIAGDIIGRKLRTHQAPISGGIVTAAGDQRGCNILDPSRWPPHFKQQIAMLRRLNEASSWIVDYTWRAAKLDEDKPALAELERRLKEGH
jgi:hypothetical protein